MKQFITLALIIVIGTLGLTSTSQAQNKIGYISADEIIVLMPEAARVDTQLNQFQQSLYQNAQDKQAELNDAVQKFYKEISGNNELISLEYNSHLNDINLVELLVSSRHRDIAAQRTNTGIHRDDLVFLLNKNNFKTTASQGQRKSLLFACKLAEFEMLSDIKGAPPLLLLDDVFEKLDEIRMKNLLQYVCKKNSGQIFITDTHKERLELALSEFQNDVQIIELN